MVEKIYYAYVEGFSFEIEGIKIKIRELEVEKETPKQYQLSRNGKKYMRLNKSYIGSSDSMGRFYALTPEEAVANFKADLKEKKEKALKEIERLNFLLDCEPIIE